MVDSASNVPPRAKRTSHTVVIDDRNWEAVSKLVADGTYRSYSHAVDVALRRLFDPDHNTTIQWPARTAAAQ